MASSSMSRRPGSSGVVILLIVGLVGVARLGASAAGASRGSLSATPTRRVAQKTRPTPRCPQQAVILHGSRTVRKVALTFDACEAQKRAGYDEAVIQILRSTRTPATLFLGGKWMESHPGATRGLARVRLFELGNHSYQHPHLPRLSEPAIRNELKRTEDIMFRLTGKRAALFRAPYGEYDNRVMRIAGQLGMKVVQWDVVSGDPDPAITATRMTRAVLRETQNGSIIVMHMNARERHTAEALPDIIAKLRAKGYSFVTASDLLKPPPVRGKRRARFAATCICGPPQLMGPMPAPGGRR